MSTRTFHRFTRVSHVAFALVAATVGLRLKAAMPLASVQLPADVPPPSEVSIGGEKLLDLGFATLSTFPYNIVDAGSGASKAEIEAAAKIDQIPKWAHAFDGRKIVLTGYMMPVQVEGGRAKKFVMMKDIMTCCYGAVPKMNDYVVVEMKGDGVEAIQDIPVQVVGVMHISEKREDGYVVSLFEMDGEKFLGVKK